MPLSIIFRSTWRILKFRSLTRPSGRCGSFFARLLSLHNRKSVAVVTGSSRHNSEKAVDRLDPGEPGRLVRHEGDVLGIADRASRSASRFAGHYAAAGLYFIGVKTDCLLKYSCDPSTLGLLFRLGR